MASPAEDEHHLHIDKNESGSRLDRVLLRFSGSQNRSLIMRLIRRGNVRINGKRAKPDTRMKCGDCIYLPASLRNTDHHLPESKAAHILPAMPVLYEDHDILVINKPAGVVVHGGSGHSTGIIESLRQTMDLPELRLAHRLDRDTSGCLLLAKRLPALRMLTAAFRDHTAHKTYLAWVAGHPDPSAGRMRSKLVKGVLRGGERMVVDHQTGKEAITDYQVMILHEQYGWPCALLALQPESGRTHQLRVQLQHEGHAILGDGKYGNKEDVKQFRALGGHHMALHAWRLRFTHPASQNAMEMRAIWPVGWMSVYSKKANLHS